MSSLRAFCFSGLLALTAAQAAPGDYLENYDTLSNNLTH